VSTRRGPGEVQLRLKSTLTFEEYVTSRAWEQATLATCPLCPVGTCHLQGLGTYMRKVPVVAFVARYYCPEQHTTFGLLPDFYASRVPGTLDDIEHTAAQAEASTGLERAAEELRPGDEAGAVTLSVAVAWVRRRVAWVRALLVTVAGLFPDIFAGVRPSIRAFRGRLGTSRILVALRGICERYLYALPPPLGLNPRTPWAPACEDERPQPIGSDSPLSRR
jgi:hypothetical protein